MKNFHPTRVGLLILTGLFLFLFNNEAAANNLKTNESNSDATCLLFTYTPPNYLIDCNEVPVFGAPIATDACCGNANINITKKDSIAHDYCETRHYRIWRATSSCGGDERTVQIITERDTTSPTLIINDPLLQAHDSGDTIWLDCSAPILLFGGSVTATDNCDSDPKMSFRDSRHPGDCSQDGYFELMKCWWIAEDSCANKSIYTIYIARHDTTDPIIDCPRDFNVDCGDNIRPNILGTATAVDDCDIDLTIRHRDDVQSGDCTDIITRTWTATDHCDNRSTCIQTIKINDNEPPQITCPPDRNYGCESDIASSGTATAVDDCKNLAVTISSNDSRRDIDDCHYIITRTWTATDICGNASSCSQKITYEDTTAPTFTTLPGNMTVECNGSGNQTELNDWISNHGGAIASDECGLDVNWDFRYISDSPVCGLTKVTVIAFTVSDDCGNATSATATFTIEDTTAPDIFNPAVALSVDCDDLAGIQIWLDANGGARAADICGSVTWSNDFDSDNLPNCGDVITITFRATDDCGNTSITTANLSINDDTPPVITSGNNPTVECVDGGFYPAFFTWIGNNGGATATDNCSDVSEIVWTNNSPGDETSNCGFTKTYTVIFTATDACGNATDYTGTFNVTDTTPPTIDAQAMNMNVPCDGTGNQLNLDNWLDANAGASASDDCGAVTWSNDFADVTPGCAATNSVTVTFTATDECGNTAATTATFAVTDNDPPLLNNVPDDMQIECNEPLPTDEPLVFDNCDQNVSMTMEDRTTQLACPQESNIRRIWTATDACGNSATAVQVIRIRDTQAPTPTSVPNAMMLTCLDPIPMTTATFDDNCDTNPTVVMSEVMTGDNCFGELIRTWTATDACGNVGTATQVLTIIDELPPMINCPADLTVNCTEPTDSLSTGLATATDQCNAITFLASVDDLDNSIPCTSVINRTWLAIDMCGNEASCIQKITVVDNEAPVLQKEDPMLAPYSDGETITFECDNAKVFEMDDFSALDNCSPVQNIIFENPTDVTDCLATGMISLTSYRWTAEDDCGNSSSFSLFVKIVDTTRPTIDTPAADLSIACGTRPNALTNWLRRNGDAEASDNCGNITWTNDFNRLTPNCATSTNTGSATVTFTATDDCGNTTSTTATFTVTDDEAPVFANVPDDLNLECSDIIPNVTPTVSDNCDATVAPVLDEQIVQGSCPQNRTITRTWTATDACGNSATAVQVIQVLDNQPPVISCPADADLQCGGDTSVAALGSATATDDCGNVSITHADVMTGNAACNMSIERTWTATDDCGNASTCVQMITLSDNTAPAFSAQAANNSAECNGSNTYPDLQNWLDANGGAAATDNCGNVTWSNDFPGTETQNCGNTVAYSVTFTATDDCGNANQTTAVFEIIDTTPPNLNTPANDLDVQCSAGGNQTDLTAWLASNGGANATDDCGNVTWSNDFSGSVANCSAGVVVTFTATDDCGNAIATTATFSITDNDPPVFANVPDDVNLECTDDLPTDAPTATDNCDSDVDISLSENMTPGSCPQNYTLVRTWTATDDCGNAATVSQTIEVRDTQAPTATSVPGAVTIGCGDPMPTDAPTFKDDCDVTPVVMMRDSSSGNNCTGGLIRMWTATDACGNAVTVTQVITIIDDAAPIIICPSDATVQCGGDITPTALGSATATDDCGNATITFADVTIDSTNCQITIERTWTATDDCGNASTCVQTITLTDSTPPSIDQPASAETVECNSVGSYPGLFDWIARNGDAAATDNCGNITWSADAPAETLNCGGTRSFSVVFTATDDCGNRTQTTGTYTVVDTTPPTLINPAMDQNIACDGTGNQTNVTNWLAANGGALAIDSCGSVTWSNDYTGLTSGCPGTGSVTVTFTATDDCGNTIATTATLSVTDNDPPILNNVPADITLQCSDPIPANQPLPFDNCDADVTISLSENETPGSCPNAKTLVRTWTATDDCGNSATASQTIEFIDTTPPTVDSLPQPISVSCGAPIPRPTVTFTDNCGGGVTIQTDSMMTGDPCFGQLVRSWTATDVCGNVATATQVITLIDDVAPNIFCPADLTVDCGMPTDTSAAGNATANDFCNAINFFAFGDSLSTSSACDSEIFRTFTAIDACGNTSTCVQKITIEDNTPPVIDCPSDTTAQCGMPVNMATAVDICSGLMTLAMSDDTTNFDPCFLEIDRTWSASDSCGNVSTCVQKLTFIDTIAPIFTVVDSNFLGINSGDTLIFSCDDVIVFDSVSVVASDNCDPASSIIFYETIISASCVDDYKIKRRCWFEASDRCGNNSLFEIYIFVIDSIAPIIYNVPADTIAKCDEIPAVDTTVYADDNCDFLLPALTFSESEVISAPNEKLITRTWSVADDCGNITTESQVIRAVNCPTVMPNFTHFEALQIPNSEVRLDWGIDQKMPYPHFYFIEHSIDNVNFSNIGIVRSEDALNVEGTEFTFTHVEPHPVNNYYRVKFKVPALELELISETRALLMNEADQLVYVYPNPVWEELTIELTKAPTRTVRYSVSNTLGQVLLAEDFDADGLLLRVDFRALTSGTYYVTVYDLIGKPITYRIIKSE